LEVEKLGKVAELPNKHKRGCEARGTIREAATRFSSKMFGNLPRCRVGYKYRLDALYTAIRRLEIKSEKQKGL
jgi:hypothetical protein